MKRCLDGLSHGRDLIAIIAINGARAVLFMRDGACDQTERATIPVFDKSNRTDGIFPRVDFKFGPERDRYTCPAANWFNSGAPHGTPRSGINGRRDTDLSRQQIGLRSL